MLSSCFLDEAIEKCGKYSEYVSVGQLRIYFVQLLFNGLWSFLFFSWHWGGAALIDIALLFALILVLMRETFVISPRISLMWLPYALWVFFAGILNLTLWQMNPAPLNFFDAGSGFELSII